MGTDKGSFPGMNSAQVVYETAGVSEGMSTAFMGADKRLFVRAEVRIACQMAKVIEGKLAVIRSLAPDGGSGDGMRACSPWLASHGD